jgi:lantibiotic biosynthesis protein
MMSDTGPSSSWRPLLSGDLEERARLVLAEIAADLERRMATPPAPESRASFSLALGTAGQSLFFAYLDAAFPGRGYGDAALDLLERSIDGLAIREAWSGLYSGFTGVGWVVEHLQERLLDPADGDPAEEIAPAIAEHLRQTPWQRNFDLIGGLAGFGAYGLERFPRPGARDCVALAVARLAELAERRPPGLTWLTPPELLGADALRMTPEGHYDLGIAHGVPGVIAFLAEAASSSLGPPETRELLGAAVDWVLSCKRSGESPAFPNFVAPGRRATNSRLAWCYGDLGIAVVLLGAARRTGEPAWEREALELARLAAARAPETSGVRDAGLCHGAAGAAHLFNRLYQASGDPLLAEAARDWLARTLDLRRPGEGCAGFLAWDVDDTGALGWRENGGFLTGTAGIGLALLAALYPIEPAWDRVLLASIPPLARHAFE